MYFNPRPPRGGRPLTNFLLLLLLQFQSTPPARGATAVIGYVGDICAISIHAPREGGDLPIGEAFSGVLLFQSTPPARGATLMINSFSMPDFLISIHAPREGGDIPATSDCKRVVISIHAPREGGDVYKEYSRNGLQKFQSTPPARGATFGGALMVSVFLFQSTPPARGATQMLLMWQLLIKISIHAPREGGDEHAISSISGFFISIHAPREGGDGVVLLSFLSCSVFQSTPPARGATLDNKSQSTAEKNFNPRPPRGGRPRIQPPPIYCAWISIHAPREGGDSKDAQFYLRIFDKQVELLRFLGKIRGGCLRNPEKGRRFLGKSLANLPEIAGHLDFAGGGKAHPGYPCAVPLPRRAACVRGSGDPPADRCSSYRNAPLFSHIASPDSKSADCLSQNP